MKYVISIVFIMFLSMYNVKAQKIESLSFSLTSETFSFPFTRLGPVHPGLEFGATVWNREKEKSIREVNLFLGGYFHKKVENGCYLRADYMHTFKVKEIVGIDLPVSLGYLHSFYPGILYEQNNETGDFNKVKQLGKPAALLNVGFGFTLLAIKKIQPIIRYESMVDFPFYNGVTSIRTFLKMGINYKL